MDDDFLARFRERSAYETAREGPPDGFPKLPDLPLGRYTDPAFQELECTRLPLPAMQRGPKESFSCALHFGDEIYFCADLARTSSSVRPNSGGVATPSIDSIM